MTDHPAGPDEDDQPGIGGLDALLSQAMEMQQQVMAAQAEAADQQVTGAAGGGAVEITVTGGMEFVDVRISPAAVDADDVELLQDLVLAALHDAIAKVNELQSQSLGALGGFGDLLSAGGLGPDPDASFIDDAGSEPEG